MEPATSIDVWTVDRERRCELIGLLSNKLESFVVTRSGFVSAEIFESVDGGVVLVSIRMRTGRDLQDLNDSPDVRRGYRQARSLANIRSNRYRVVKSFGVSHGPELERPSATTRAA